MSTVVSLDNVSVEYRRVTTKTRSLKQASVDILKGKRKFQTFRALDGVSFEINSGEILAIIGRNGSGKSTLLKVISRVIPPTNGRIIVKGHVEPMIELGVGFNPELSGRENIMLNAAIHGRDVKIVKERMEDLVSWAGLQEVIDLPLRTYSSGMVARLGFAVATDINPDIVLVDEVLAVGDIDFMEKSRARMEKIMGEGSTVVLVSHDLETIRSLATRAIWMEQGKVRAEGATNQVVDAYVNNAHG
jgi:ABC-type polysaccharide/polyol phosphate transport system ATPase subunit